MPQKSRAAIKLLFATGNLSEGDFIDFADSHFNLIDDNIDGSLILDGSIGLNELNASVLTFLNTPDGLRAWDVTLDGDLVPFASHFQDIGSPTDVVKEIYVDDLIVYSTTNLPLATTIGAVTSSEISYLDGLTGNIQQQIDNITIGGGGVVAYTHIQNIPSILWTIIHNKNTENLVYTLLDENKYEVYPNTFRIIDDNTVEFAFVAPQLGKVNMVFY